MALPPRCSSDPFQLLRPLPLPAGSDHVSSPLPAAGSDRVSSPLPAAGSDHVFSLSPLQARDFGNDDDDYGGLAAGGGSAPSNKRDRTGRFGQPASRLGGEVRGDEGGWGRGGSGCAPSNKCERMGRFGQPASCLGGEVRGYEGGGGGAAVRPPTSVTARDASGSHLRAWAGR